MEEGFDSNMVYSQNVTDFVTVASEYCTFVENSNRFSKVDFLDKTRKLLPLLYLKGSLLPKLESVFDDENEKFVSEEEWDFIQKSIQKKLGFHDECREVFDPLTHEQIEQSTGSISDNLSDLYQDLKDFITLYNIGTEEIMNDAIWDCQLNFEEFWGQKLLNALKAVHNVFFSGEDLNDETDVEDENENPNTNDWIISKRQEDYRKEE